MKTPEFKTLLKKAARSAKREAHRKNLPFAISENGKVKLIYPDKKVKILQKSSRLKKVS